MNHYRVYMDFMQEHDTEAPTPQATHHVQSLRITLTELLEAERTVSDNLSGNVSCTLNLHANINHLEWTPMLVAHQVTKELWCCLLVILIAGV